LGGDVLGSQDSGGLYMKVTLLGKTFESWDLYVIFESLAQGGIIAYAFNNRMYGPLVLQVVLLGAQVVATLLIKKAMKAKQWLN
jgi:hypothetical protein